VLPAHTDIVHHKLTEVVDMFAWWGSVVQRRRWVVVAVVLGLCLVSGVWGAGVFGELGQGGYDDPNSQSAQVEALAAGQLGHPAADVVVVYTAPPGKTVDDPVIAAEARSGLHSLPHLAVRGEISYWDTHAAQLVTRTAGERSPPSRSTRPRQPAAGRIHQYRA
jgi:RND superfamily putative drug exporter